ncbi:universal stress protein [Pseudodesulfovibrio sp.]|uniref:universal stress protein n=1 Tax=Pseudodesulfovibrio sp. TaxID=2035812 RepID=UPI00262C8496|nr:universal stress protein [Pseudodesulfovibrio sp.]MDD3313671.1 universal stress protein [Pseudodesulfovibrio sp.]
MFKKILLAATPQIAPEAAPQAAFDLARQHDAELVVYHALPLCQNAWCTFEDIVPEEKLVESARQKIAATFAQGLEGTRHEVRVVTGPAHEKLLKIIHTEGVDLVVMGHHTGSMIRPDRMWGTVDTSIRKVCSNVFSPVLVVTQPSPQMAGIKRILMATDFSTPSDSALCYAVQLARQTGAHIDVFHVLDVGARCPEPKYYMQDMNVFIEEAKAKMEKRYAKPLTGISHTFDCWEGAPYTEILKKARWSGADVIVMAQYSSSQEPAAATVGSTVIQVALSPGCPTLIVNYRARVCM